MASRQYLWQQRQLERGKCEKCGGTLSVRSKRLCFKHLEAQKNYPSRKRAAKEGSA